MIQEHFCNYENSLALIKLGFDEESLPLKILSSGYVFDPFHQHDSKDSLQAILLSQAIQWIQEHFNIFIDITHSVELFDIPNGWRYEIRLEGSYMTGNGDYETWNQCAQDAIMKCLQIIKDEETKRFKTNT